MTGRQECGLGYGVFGIAMDWGSGFSTVVNSRLVEDASVHDSINRLKYS